MYSDCCGQLVSESTLPWRARSAASLIEQLEGTPRIFCTCECVDLCLRQHVELGVAATQVSGSVEDLSEAIGGRCGSSLDEVECGFGHRVCECGGRVPGGRQTFEQDGERRSFVGFAGECEG